MLSIGEFSKMSRVTTNALRYYDEIGLLKPAMINAVNGYRYYEGAQLQTILMIQKLKACQLSLEEIMAVMRQPEDNTLLLDLIRLKRNEIVAQMAHLDETMTLMDKEIWNLERGIHIMSYMDNIEVQLKEMQPQNILFVRREMSTKEVASILGELAERIKEEKLTATGAPINIFHHEEEFNPDCYDNELAIPIKEKAEGTRQLPGGLCAMVSLHGPYTELASVYARLQQWIEKEGYEVTSAPYEAYISDPFVTPENENITEVYFPVKKK